MWHPSSFLYGCCMHKWLHAQVASLGNSISDVD